MTNIHDHNFWKKLTHFIRQNQSSLPQYILNDIQKIESITHTLNHQNSLSKLQIIHANRIISNFKKYNINLNFSTSVTQTHEAKTDIPIDTIDSDKVPCPPHDYETTSKNPKRIIRKCIKCSDQSIEKIY